MSDIKNYKGIFNLQQLDIRLEVILADLVFEKFNLEELMVFSSGQFQRNYHNDIEKIEEREFGKLKKKKLCFTVNRNGMYDNLPEDIFHQPTTSKTNRDKTEVITEMKIQESLEKSARTFFIPYEQEFYRQRIKLELEERKFLFETNSEISGQLFNDLWNLPDFLNTEQKSKLGVLMPVINRMAGKMDLMGLVFGNITGDTVEIKDTRPLTFIIPDQAALGGCRLGLDCILGGNIEETQRALTMSIYLKDPEDLMEYMPGGNKNRIYNFLCNLLIPLENDLVFELLFENGTTTFELDDDAAYAGRLNYTTII
jgi:type VI secretion system protein ImpH